MKVKNLLFSLCLLLAIFFGGGNEAQAVTKLDVYANSELAETEAILYDGNAMLPMREVFGMFGCDNVEWNQEDKSVTAIYGIKTLELQVGNDQAMMTRGDSEAEAMDLAQAPVIVDGRTYLPLRFIAEEFYSYITYENHKVYMSVPFKFEDNCWYQCSSYFQAEYYEPTWKKITSNVDTDLITDEGIYRRIILESGMMNDTYGLYFLGNDGTQKYIGGVGNRDYAILDNKVVYRESSSSPLSRSTLIKAYDFVAEPNISLDLGVDDYYYGTKHSKDGADLPEWKATDEGVYAIGYHWESLVEGEVLDVEKFNETYGYYFLPYEGGTHELIQSLEYKY